MCSIIIRRRTLSFLQSPKSEIMARTSPFFPGMEMSTLWGLMSLWTMSKLWRCCTPWVACRNIVMASNVVLMYLVMKYKLRKLFKNQDRRITKPFCCGLGKVRADGPGPRNSVQFSNKVSLYLDKNIILRCHLLGGVPKAQTVIIRPGDKNNSTSLS